MTILTVGKEGIATLIKNDLTIGSYGTDGTAVTESDTALGAEVVATQKTLTKVQSSKQITMTHSLNSTEGNGNTYKEYATKLGTNLLNRVNLFDLTKTSSEEFQTTTILQIL